ncbi:hypothetical protein RGUI_3219 [Rhodovulum sp. P5]|nr:hypothetical protein RGUI_3219 [Rhodovulum sp. P5]
MSEIGKTHTGHQPNIPGTDHRNFHGSAPKRCVRGMAMRHSGPQVNTIVPRRVNLCASCHRPKAD